MPSEGDKINAEELRNLLTDVVRELSSKHESAMALRRLIPQLPPKRVQQCSCTHEIGKSTSQSLCNADNEISIAPVLATIEVGDEVDISTSSGVVKYKVVASAQLECRSSIQLNVFAPDVLVGATLTFRRPGKWYTHKQPDGFIQEEEEEHENRNHQPTVFELGSTYKAQVFARICSNAQKILDEDSSLSMHHIQSGNYGGCVLYYTGMVRTHSCNEAFLNAEIVLVLTSNPIV
jgi:hypothetical protein